MRIAPIAACAALACGPALAQTSSSVTLYGVMDVGVVHSVGSDSSITAMAPNRTMSSRIGFSGLEDLGGGLKAKFTLEGDVLPPTGTGVTQPLPGWASSNNTTPNATGGFQFNRISTVSLASGIGELQLGRYYTPTFMVDANYDPLTSNGSGFSLISGTGVFYTAVGSVNHLRASNLIQYSSPTAAGFSGSLAYAPSAAPSTAPRDGAYSGGRLSYLAGPASADVAVGKTTLAAIGDLKTASVGGSYDFGRVKPMFEYSEDKQGAAGDNGRKKGYLLGAWVPIGLGQWRFQYASVSRTSDSTTEGKVKQWAIGYVYNLSKRTALTATVTHVKNSNYFNTPTAGYQVGGVVTSPNGSVNAQEVGIRTIF